MVAGEVRRLIGHATLWKSVATVDGSTLRDGEFVTVIVPAATKEYAFVVTRRGTGYVFRNLLSMMERVTT